MRVARSLGAVIVLAAACSGSATEATGSSTPPTATAAPTTSGSTAPAPSAPEPAFEARISTVTAEDLHASWRPGCPLRVEGLRALDVSHWGFDGEVHEGRIIVSAELAEQVADVLREAFDAGFPIERMEPIDVYGGDDNRSMAANNTSGFNCRAATGGSGWSEHAYGRAIDVNPIQNPYVTGSTVLPPEGGRFADRSSEHPALIRADGALARAFADRGWGWGGNWNTLKDYQHFSTSGR